MLASVENPTLASLPTPALILDLEVLRRNIAQQAARASALGVRLRPHIKTHKCLEVAALQRDAGATGFTVSTMAEAMAFADAGFDDLTWAFPIVPSRVPEVLALSTRIRLGVVVDSIEAVDLLSATGAPLHVWLEVDCGDHRSGVDPMSSHAIEIARRLHDSRTLRFAGVLTHAGHSYACRNGVGLREVAEAERAAVVDLADRLRDERISVEGVSVGSTPTMSAADDLSGVTEARPGNYVFHDYSQCVIGSTDIDGCALTISSTVVSAQPGAGRSVLDAGALALSKEGAPSGVRPTMGRIFEDYAARRLYDDVMLTALSQEHGVVAGALPIGARVHVLPNHSCLAAACFDRYHVLEGDVIVAEWPIHRAR